MEPNTCVYELTKSIQYTPKGKGDFDECYSIELDAPTYKNLKASLKLSQLVAKMQRDLINELQKAGVAQEQPAESDEKAEITATMVSQMILNSSVDIDELIGAFESMILTGMAKLDEGGTILKKTHMESMLADDVFGLMCKYIEVFTIPSILRGV